METTYFVLGVLSVVALIFIGVIAWGMFKISKQQTEIGNLKEDIQGLMRTISQEIEYTSRRIDNERIDTHRNLEKVYQQFKECEENSARYTDKRIDKLIDTYLIRIK